MRYVSETDPRDNPDITLNLFDEWANPLTGDVKFYGSGWEQLFNANKRDCGLARASGFYSKGIIRPVTNASRLIEGSFVVGGKLEGVDLVTQSALSAFEVDFDAWMLKYGTAAVKNATSAMGGKTEIVIKEGWGGALGSVLDVDYSMLNDGVHTIYQDDMILRYDDKMVVDGHTIYRQHWFEIPLPTFKDGTVALESQCVWGASARHGDCNSSGTHIFGVKTVSDAADADPTKSRRLKTIYFCDNWNTQSGFKFGTMNYFIIAVR